MLPERITKKWLALIKATKEKGGLGINTDFYSLKHLNFDETASILSIEAASQMAGQSSTIITIKHYAINEESRKMEKLKKIDNSFAQLSTIHYLDNCTPF